MRTGLLHKATHAAFFASLGSSEGSLTAGCTPKVPQNRRIFLTSNAQAMHGTTALMMLLMSSSRLSTLCAGQIWQCEGYIIAKKSGWCNEQVSTGKWICHKPLTSESTLNTFSEYWKLKRPVLYDKEFPGADWFSALLSTASIPSKMKEYGITRLDRAHLFMWTPLCVRGLSSHSHFAPWARPNLDLSDRKESEVKSLETLRDQHAKLVSAGVPVLVINYADLLWRQDVTVRRLLKFMPCLEQLDTDFIPKMNVDVFPGNQFKVHKGIRDFGIRYSATSCGYNIRTHHCSNSTLYDQLSPKLKHRLVRAEAYFQELSYD